VDNTIRVFEAIKEWEMDSSLLPSSLRDKTEIQLLSVRELECEGEGKTMFIISNTKGNTFSLTIDDQKCLCGYYLPMTLLCFHAIASAM
jgi:hypothetical protein